MRNLLNQYLICFLLSPWNYYSSAQQLISIGNRGTACYFSCATPTHARASVDNVALLGDYVVKMLNHKEMNKARRRSLMLVSLMLGSILLSLVPAVNASRVETYNVQRNPTTLASGDLDCDGDADIVSGSEMNMFISVLYNDDGDFSDRDDIWVGNNVSRRAFWFELADASDVAIGDINNDGANDIVYFQANVRVVGGNIIMGNLTIIWGDCDSDASDWTQSNPITTSPYIIGMEVTDVNDDDNDDIVLLMLDESITNMEISVFRGPDPTNAAFQTNTNVPLTHAYYYDMNLGSWGETVTGGPFSTDCTDVDLWMMTAPPYNGPQSGFAAGNWDNITVLEYDCTTNTYANPTPGSPTAQYSHKFAMDSDNDGKFDVADSNGDGDIDMVAMTDGWDQNITYATRSGVNNNWNTGNLVNFGAYVAADVSIEDINQDGEMDFLIPTQLTVTEVNSAGTGQDIQLTTENLQDINTVNIVLADGSGGYFNPQVFNVGRRPTMVIADQFSGGANSALDLAVGQRDYAYGYSNGALWLDSKGWAGQIDSIAIVELDNEDVGIAGMTVAPASWDPEDRDIKIGEGTRTVNVTVRNTGLQPISGTVDVDVSVSEVTGGTDTVVYANDFDTPSTGSCSACGMYGVSYSNEWDTTSWHVEQGNNNSGNGEPHEADTNPTDFMWAGVTYLNDSAEGGDGDMETGYLSYQDEGLIIENVDLTGADSASMDLDLYCAVNNNIIYWSSTGIANRIIYDDSCLIEVFSESSGWTTLDYYGGYDLDRYVHINAGYPPEYTVNNGRYYRGTIYAWIDLGGDNGIDLTPWAGETVDIRFRFRSGIAGSVGNDNKTNNNELDGYAFDNLSINKTVTQFGANVQNVQQQLTLTNLGPGEEEIVSLSANFVDGVTYIIDAKLVSTNGFTNGDSTNDDIVWKTTVKNLFDPAVEEITSFVKNQLYPAGDYPIDVMVMNRGNTVTDFDVEATIYNAIPNSLMSEDFEGGAAGYSFGDDGDNFGIVVDDTDPSVNNLIVPGQRPVFGSSAYWFGHPDDGYGDDWNETMDLQSIDLTGNTADFVYLSFDYFAETDYLTDSEGDIVGILDYAGMEVEWRKGSKVFNGRILGNWNDYNENGIQYNETCEDIDDDDRYDETEYMGDFGYNIFFDSEGLAKGVTLDLTHIFLLNTTSSDSRDWDYNCTSLRDSLVNIKFVFQSNDDGVSGNAGLAGFAIDNVTVQEYVFTELMSYNTSVTGLDSQEKLEVNVGNHNFDHGIYRIDAMTIFDNQTQGTAWYGAKEVGVANNVSRLIFSVESVDVTLFGNDIVLDCVEAQISCVYPIDSIESHSFTVEMQNGVLAGDYNVFLKVVDMTDGSVVDTYLSDENEFNLDRDEEATATWTAPYNSWIDGHMYNLTFYARLTDGTPTGNNWYYHITFKDMVDVAILTDHNEQNRLDNVRNDLSDLGMTYTQFNVNDWETYVTSGWMGHYNKILMPWQTETSADTGGYYSALDSQRTDGTSAIGVILARMQAGATLQMHLSPSYSSGTYECDQQSCDFLPYDLKIINRDTAGNFITHDNTQVVDWYHPLLDGINPAMFISFNGGNHVAAASMSNTQAENAQLPSMCGAGTNGWMTAPYGTFNSIIQDENDPSQTLLATCAIGSGGMIISTIDAEFVSESDKPLLKNMLSHQVTPYPDDFGPATYGFELLINGQARPWDTLTNRYSTMYMKSNGELDFSFSTDALAALDADWELRSASGTTATNWDGNPLSDGAFDHRADDSHSATFCVLDAQSSTGCKQDAAWVVTLFLHDDEGHTRVARINLVTNDTRADEYNPVPSSSIIDRLDYRDQLEYYGTYNSSGKEWDVYLLHLGPTGDLTLHFDASNSSDADATDGTNGIKQYMWNVMFDEPWDARGSSGLSGHSDSVWSSVSHTWAYKFQNITVDPTGQTKHKIKVELTVIDQADKPSTNADKFRIYFYVVGEGYGDEEPDVEITSPVAGSTQTGDYVFVNGTVLSGSENGNVMIEVAFDQADLDLNPTQKFAKKTQGLYNSTSGLGDTDTFSISLKLIDLYTLDGAAKTVYIKITEGSGERWIIHKSVDINLAPKVDDPCIGNPDAEGCGDSGPGQQGGGGGFGSVWLFAIIAIFAVLLIVIVATVLIVRRGGKSADSEYLEGGDASFGGVEEMDPVEAYVQQLVAQGYPEETARAYAQQYYAQNSQQQGG